MPVVQDGVDNPPEPTGEDEALSPDWQDYKRILLSRKHAFLEVSLFSICLNVFRLQFTCMPEA